MELLNHSGYSKCNLHVFPHLFKEIFSKEILQVYISGITKQQVMGAHEAPVVAMNSPVATAPGADNALRLSLIFKPFSTYFPGVITSEPKMIQCSF